MATMKMPCAVGSGGSTEEELQLTVTKSFITWHPISCKIRNGFVEVFGTMDNSAASSTFNVNVPIMSGFPTPERTTDESAFVEVGTLIWTNTDTGKALAINSDGELVVTKGGGSNPFSGNRVYICYKVAD